MCHTDEPAIAATLKAKNQGTYWWPNPVSVKETAGKPQITVSLKAADKPIIATVIPVTPKMLPFVAVAGVESPRRHYSSRENEPKDEFHARTNMKHIEQKM